MNVVDDMFNPLRFIALHLKELNEQDKLEKAKKAAEEGNWELVKIG